MVKVYIEKLVFGGRGFGKIDGKPFFVWGALPGEDVEVKIIKEKKDYCEGEAVSIIKPSKYRIEAREDHYLSCGPWQILDFCEENIWKQKIALETYAKIGKIQLDSIDIITDEKHQYEYRNKINFRFTTNAQGELSLAEMKRNDKEKVALQSCKLVDKNINKIANDIVHWLKEQKIIEHDLKSLVLRSNRKNEVIAGLFTRGNIQLNMKTTPLLGSVVKGFFVYSSNPRSPVSTPDTLVWSSGTKSIEEKILGIDLQYGLLNFFQVNVPIFEQALLEIKNFLDPKKSIIDYYAGVGAISLPLHEYWKDCKFIESDEGAVRFALENIKKNNIKHCEAYAATSEDMPNCITSDKFIIFDPPRAGLATTLIKKILSVLPSRIIYLSCNLSTQARDIEKLSRNYSISFIKLFNFFPRTPHIEGLCVLNKRK